MFFALTIVAVSRLWVECYLRLERRVKGKWEEVGETKKEQLWGKPRATKAGEGKSGADRQRYATYARFRCCVFVFLLDVVVHLQRARTQTSKDQLPELMLQKPGRHRLMLCGQVNAEFASPFVFVHPKPWIKEFDVASACCASLVSRQRCVACLDSCFAVGNKFELVHKDDCIRIPLDGEITPFPIDLNDRAGNAIGSNDLHYFTPQFEYKVDWPNVGSASFVGTLGMVFRSTS